MLWQSAVAYGLHISFSDTGEPGASALRLVKLVNEFTVIYHCRNIVLIRRIGHRLWATDCMMTTMNQIGFMVR